MGHLVVVREASPQGRTLVLATDSERWVMSIMAGVKVVLALTVAGDMYECRHGV